MACSATRPAVFTAGGGTTGDGPSSEEIQRRLEEALPSWLTPVSILLGVLSLIALITALILLALPKANQFFRKPTAAWEPPTPGASYPGYPQAPGQPGYPQASGEPGYPSSGEPSYPPPGEPAGRHAAHGPARVNPAVDELTAR